MLNVINVQRQCLCTGAWAVICAGAHAQFTWGSSEVSVKITRSILAAYMTSHHMLSYKPGSNEAGMKEGGNSHKDTTTNV